MTRITCPKITCIGIACLDMIFQIDVLPSSFTKYRAKDVVMLGGGLAGNAAVACARLGAKTSLITRLGDDKIGDMILEELTSEGIDCALSPRFKGRQSPISSIFVDQTGERMIMSYSDHDLPKDASWLPPLNADAVLGDTRWEVGALALFTQAQAANIPAILDADRGIIDINLLHAASHVGFSAQGLREITGMEDLQTALKSLTTSNFLCVTDGENGVYYKENGRIKHLPAFKITVKDTLAAGDTWHGAFAVALSEQQPIETALRFANAAAALKCTKFGGRTGIPTRVDVELFLKTV
jgi:sulfofructose kinase